MGQTLTHGIYLPDEGERNCYAGLAANWQLLDGAVGTIAEHTSALAGKAPLVHTHTKSDITDLFNSANTWTGEQTFSVPCKTLGKKLLTGITDLDDAYYNGEVCKFAPNTLHSPTGAYGNVLTINNAVNVPDNAYNSWITQIATAPDGSYLGIRNRSNGNAWTSWTRILTESRAIPTVTNTYDLGSSSYQWNNLYAKNYYYNGVAWGLDKANVWSALNCYRKGIWLDGARDAYIFPENTASYSGLIFATQAYVQSFKFGDFTTSDDEVSFNSSNAYLNIYAGYYSDGNKNRVEISPKNADEASLGTPTYKWKTLNGINPGILSLPDYDRFEPIDFSQFDVNLGWNNLYTPSEDGWLYAEISDTATNSIYLYSATLQPVQNVNRKYGISAQGNGSQQTGYGGGLAVMIPVRKDIQYRFLIKASAVSDIYAITFYPCCGNV